MAKDRLQVRPLAAPKEIVPKAAPVDIYRRAGGQPPAQGPTEMGQLMAALGRLQPTLLNIADVNHAEMAQREISAGEQAVLADKKLANRKALKDAVERGEIPAARNPWFLQGARQQVYRLEGEDFDRSLREAYANSDARNSEDIAGFTTGFTQEYLKAKQIDPSDPEVGRILTPAIERSQANLFGAHRQERDAALVQQVETNTDREIGLLLDRMGEQGGTPEEYGAQVHGIVQEQYLNGLSGTRANMLTAKAIARKAEESLDPEYLDLLDHIPGGSGPIAQIGAIKDLRNDTERRIYQLTEERDRISSKVNKEAKEAESAALVTEGFNTILDNPTADLKPLLRKIAATDPEKAQQMYAWQQAQINGADKLNVDEGVEVALTAKVYSGNGNMAEVIQAHRQGLISTDTAKKLAENLDRSKEFRSPLKDPTVSEMHRRIGTTIGGSDVAGRTPDGINAMRAQNSFLESMSKYKKSNPDATDLDVLNYGSSLQEKLLKVYAKDATADAESSVEITSPDTALMIPAASVPWSTQPIFANKAELKQAVLDYNNGVPNNMIERLAAHLRVDPAVLFQTQAKLVNQPMKK